MGDVTKIPTWTIPTTPTSSNVGIGPVAVNPRPTVDYTKELDAEVLNYIRELAVYHQQMVGVPPNKYARTPPVETLRQLASPGQYVFYEPFDGLSISAHYWTAGGAAFPALVDGPSGGASFALNATNICIRLQHLWARAQCPHVSVDLIFDGVPSNDKFAYFAFGDATTNEGWGVTFQKTSTLVRAFTRTGGSDTLHTVGTWDTGTNYHVEAWVDEDFTLWVSVNGAVAVDCGDVPAGDMTFWIKTEGATVAHMIARNLMITANWIA
jgi:hypothetical protein